MEADAIQKRMEVADERAVAIMHRLPALEKELVPLGVAELLTFDTPTLDRQRVRNDMNELIM